MTGLPALAAAWAPLLSMLLTTSADLRVELAQGALAELAGVGPGQHADRDHQPAGAAVDRGAEHAGAGRHVGPVADAEEDGADVEQAAAAPVGEGGVLRARAVDARAPGQAGDARHQGVDRARGGWRGEEAGEQRAGEEVPCTGRASGVAGGSQPARHAISPLRVAAQGPMHNPTNGRIHKLPLVARRKHDGWMDGRVRLRRQAANAKSL